MKHLLLFPPAWQPTAPHLAIPTLLGQMKKGQLNVEAIDLNIEFYNDILKKSYLEKSIKALEKIQIETSIEAEKYDVKDKKIEDYSIEIQTILLKDKTIKEYMGKKSHLLKTIPNSIEKAVANLKDPDQFYKPNSFLNSYMTIQKALEIVSLPYAPARVLFSQYVNPLLELNYENIKFNVFSKSTNIYINYFKKWLPIIQKKKPKFIGISIAANSQIIPALTLANLLKTNTNAHICIGGNLFSRIVDSVVKCPEFFDTFADSILVEAGEKSIIELAKHIDNKIPIEEVPNLIYKESDKVITNEICKPLKINEIAQPSYEGFDFSKYLTPKVILPIQTTKGCYWGKCTFCDIAYGEEYNVKDVDKVIDEIKTYKEKYGITNFCIIDEAIHPKHFEEMSEKIIENKLNINYMSYGRTEKGFTKEIFKKMSESGLKMVLWGIESGSKRIMSLINKGVDLDNRFEILRESSNAGIWNHVFAFFGFPTETIDEGKETIEEIYSNSDIIHSTGIGDFFLGRHSKITKKPELYGITEIKNEEQEFSTALKYEAKEMTEEEVISLRDLDLQELQKAFGSPLWRYSRRDYIFLYISHYGRDWITNYKLQIE